MNAKLLIENRTITPYSGVPTPKPALNPNFADSDAKNQHILSRPDEIFLRAFIGTTSPLKVFSFGGVVIPFPYAFPEAINAQFDRLRKKPCTPLLSEPKIVGLLPAPTPSRIGQVIAIAGLSQTCTIENVFDKWDETWVQVRHPYGIATRKLSEIGD